MSTIAVNELFQALLLSVVAFQRDYEEKRKEEQDERDGMSETELEEAGDEEYPEEVEVEAFTERFTDWLESEGLDAYRKAKVTADDSKRLDHILGRG